jgi:hypothetical protein
MKTGDLVTYTEEYRSVAGEFYGQFGIYLYSEPWAAGSAVQGFIYFLHTGRITGIILEKDGRLPVFKVVA